MKTPPKPFKDTVRLSLQYAPVPFVAPLALALVGSTIAAVVEPIYLMATRINLRRLIIEKCLRMKYRHFDDPDKIDTMDTVYNRVETALCHMAVYFVPSIITSHVDCYRLLDPTRPGRVVSQIGSG